MDAQWMRIWWGRPLAMESSTRSAPDSRSSSVRVLRALRLQVRRPDGSSLELDAGTDRAMAG
jgi:hypothetical protein